jgi:hypothetical protein
MLITNVWNGTPSSTTGTLSGSFVTNGGYAQLDFAGSAWSGSGPAIVGTNLIVDGNNVTTARVFTNEQGSHKALVPVSVVLRLAAGSHTVSIQPATTQTRLDQNDFFTLVVTELSFA